MIILKYKFLFVVKKNYLLIFLLFKNFYIKYIIFIQKIQKIQKKNIIIYNKKK